MKLKSLLIGFLLIFAFQLRAEETLFEKGIEKMALKEYKAAGDYFEQAIQISPNFSNYYNLGVSYGELGKWGKAKWAFESALKYKPLSGRAQYNAEFVTHQVDGRQVWEHPYSWGKRLVIGMGNTTWITLAFISSLALGFLIFTRISKKNWNGLGRWSNLILILMLTVFTISFYAMYQVNSHYHSVNYAIAFERKPSLFISPNGVSVEGKVRPSDRLEIVGYNQDSTWVKVMTLENQSYWLKAEDLLCY